MSLLLLFPSLSLVESLFLPHVEVRSSGSIRQHYISCKDCESLLDLPGYRCLDGQVRVNTVNLIISLTFDLNGKRDILGGNRSSSCDR